MRICRKSWKRVKGAVEEWNSKVEPKNQVDMGAHEAKPVGDWVMPFLGGPGVEELERPGAVEPED